MDIKQQDAGGTAAAAADKPATAAVPEGNGMPLQAVIFDVDGTLSDTEPSGHRVAFNRAFDEFGLDWHWSESLYGELLAVTGGKERIRHYAKTHAPDLLGRVDIDTWVARLHRMKSEIYANLVLAGRLPLRPGIARLIHELRDAGVRLAIATTTTPSSLRTLIMAHFGHDVMSLFEVVGAGDVVPHKKPAPDIYHWVLRQLDLPPEACLVIEDSVPGLQASIAAHIPTLITVSAYTADDCFDGAISVVSDLGEPRAPARTLAGLPLAGACVDLAQLRLWHAAAQRQFYPA